MDMKHISWWEGDDTRVPALRRLVRLCDYLENANNRDSMRRVLLHGHGRGALWLASRRSRTMDSQGNCKRCSACAVVLKVPTGLTENWIDDAALTSPYWLVNAREAEQQPSLAAAREKMRIERDVSARISESLPAGVPELAAIVRSADSRILHRLCVRTEKGEFMPVSLDAGDD